MAHEQPFSETFFCDVDAVAEPGLGHLDHFFADTHQDQLLKLPAGGKLLLNTAKIRAVALALELDEIAMGRRRMAEQGLEAADAIPAYDGGLDAVAVGAGRHDRYHRGTGKIDMSYLVVRLVKNFAVRHVDPRKA